MEKTTDEDKNQALEGESEMAEVIWRVRIGETWLICRVYKDVIHFENMKGEFLGLIKTKS